MRPSRYLVILLVVGGAVAGCVSEGGVAEETPPPRPHVFLWPHPYPDLVVEIDYVKGWEPSKVAVEALLAMLHEETDKREITLLSFEEVPRQTLMANDRHEWSFESLMAWAYQHRDAAPHKEITNGTSAVLHVLFLDGRFESAAGVEIDRTAFIFEPTGWTTGWQNTSPARDIYQRTLLIHEVGHVLGLVDNGVPMVRPHNLPEDRYHSRNPESVMHPGVEDLPRILGIIDSGQAPPYRLDEDDKADLAAFRALAPGPG